MTPEVGRKYGEDRVAYIEVGDGASMKVPLSDWLWQLRYVRPEPDRVERIADDRMLAAGVLEDYMYLVQRCSKEEIWRRIKIMRKALQS